MRKEGNVLFNDALNTFYLRLYGVRHMVKDHSDSERGNSLPPHGLLFSINIERHRDRQRETEIDRDTTERQTETKTDIHADRQTQQQKATSEIDLQREVISAVCFKDMYFHHHPPPPPSPV